MYDTQPVRTLSGPDICRIMRREGISRKSLADRMCETMTFVDTIRRDGVAGAVPHHILDDEDGTAIRVVGFPRYNTVRQGVDEPVEVIEWLNGRVHRALRGV